MTKFDTLERVTLPRDAPEPEQRVRGNVFTSNAYRILDVPRCRVTRTSNFSVATGGVVVTFDATAEFDTDSFYPASASTKVTVHTTGLYDVSGYLLHDTASAAGNGRGGWILKNGVTTTRYGQAIDTPSVGHGVTSFPRDEMILNAGDYVELFAFQDSGGAQNIIINSGLPAAKLSLTFLSSTV